ncbi:hypothetical protein V8C26DRAFT_437674 [Trichoderma gracile]
MQNFTNPPTAQVDQNLTRQIQTEMAELGAVLDDATRMEFPDIFIVIRAVGNRFQRLVDKVRQMQADLLLRENQLLRKAERVQVMNITLRQAETEPNTNEQSMELKIVADLMEDVELKWELLQESQAFYTRLNRQLRGIYQWIARVAKTGLPREDEGNAPQDSRSIDGAARGAQASDGITEGRENGEVEEMEEDAEEESEEEETEEAFEDEME